MAVEFAIFNILWENTCRLKTPRRFCLFYSSQLTGGSGWLFYNLGILNGKKVENPCFSWSIVNAARSERCKGQRPRIHKCNFVVKTEGDSLVWNQLLRNLKRKMWGDIAYYIPTVWNSGGNASPPMSEYTDVKFHWVPADFLDGRIKGVLQRLPGEIRYSRILKDRRGKADGRRIYSVKTEALKSKPILTRQEWLGHIIVANTLLPASSLTNPATTNVLCWLSRELIRPLKHSMKQQKSCHMTRKVSRWTRKWTSVI